MYSPGIAIALNSERFCTNQLWPLKIAARAFSFTILSGFRGTDSSRGSVNEKHFQSLSDADPRIGPRLEVYAAGQYLWIPFEHITYIEIPAPRQLRDLLWAPALVRTGPAFRDKELGEVLIPVISPMSFEHPDDAVKLGRATEWQSADGVDVPLGQKMLLADDEEIPFLEIRTITFDEIGEVQ